MAGQRRQQRGEQGRRLGQCAPAGRGGAAPRRGRRGAGRGRAGRRARRPAGRARGRCRAARAAAGAASRASPESPSNKATRSSRASIRGAVEQGRAEIGGEQARAGAGDACGRPQASRLPARLPECRLGQLEALAGRRVDHHMVARARARPAGAGRAAIRARPRRDRRAGRRPRTGRRGRTGRSRRAWRRRTAPSAGARRRGCRSRRGAASRAGHRLGRDDLRRRQPRQLGVERARPAPRPARTGRSRCRRRRCRSARPTFATAASQLARARIEQRLLGQRAGGDHPDDGAVDHRLGAALLRLGRALDLLGDGDAVAGPDQPREIGFGGVDRHAAHRDRRAVMLAARGQRDVEALRPPTLASSKNSSKKSPIR